MSVELWKMFFVSHERKAGRFMRIIALLYGLMQLCCICLAMQIYSTMKTKSE